MTHISLRQLIDDAPVVGKTSDSVTKIISSRAAIMSLPSPQNVARLSSTIVDIPITLILSTSGKTPQPIRDLTEASEIRDLLVDADNILLGLCLSGRRLPIEMYLHKGLFDTKYASDDVMLENIFWHELLHGFEGVYVTPDGEVRRKTPWSFQLQKRMQQLEALSGNPYDASHLKNPQSALLLGYLHKGADLQDNVSELFARVGVLMLRHIRDEGLMPQTPKQVYDMLGGYGLTIEMPHPPIILS